MDVTLDSGVARVTIRPARGGMATRFVVGSRTIFYLDETTLEDLSKNVRGGNPVLFPSPGKLADGSMKQHGFARNLPWTVIGDGVIELGDNEETRAQYPHAFRYRIAYRLNGTTLRLDQVIENRGDTPMPFGVGFHPYFEVADKASARISTAATRAFDNVTKSDVAIDGPIDLTKPEVDLHLHDHGSTSSTLSTSTGSITVRGSAEYTHWVVWTVTTKPFVCLEPWSCPGNALATGDRIITLAPGESRAMWIEIEA